MTFAVGARTFGSGCRLISVRLTTPPCIVFVTCIVSPPLELGLVVYMCRVFLRVGSRLSPLSRTGS